MTFMFNAFNFSIIFFGVREFAKTIEGESLTTDSIFTSETPPIIATFKFFIFTSGEYSVQPTIFLLSPRTINCFVTDGVKETMRRVSFLFAIKQFVNTKNNKLTIKFFFNTFFPNFKNIR